MYNNVGDWQLIMDDIASRIPWTLALIERCVCPGKWKVTRYRRRRR